MKCRCPAALGVACLVVLSFAACDRGPPSGREPTLAALTSGASPAPQVVLPDFATLAARVVPSVVKIETEQKVKVSGSTGEPFDLFHFGPHGQRELESRGLGSGFFIEPSGLVLTNAHVIEEADDIKVTFSTASGDERTLEARVVAQASEFDVALLRTLEDAHAPVLAFGDSDVTRIGDWVMAVGNPFGLTHSVSVGIISAKERRDVTPSGRQGLYDFLQTDASINPGNSGGPLIDTRGQVIGINSAVNSSGQGIGFAIPINMVKKMLPALEKGGRYQRSWIGVRIQSLTPDLARSYGMSTAQGVLVSEVVEKSPASDAGVREGDVILEFDGQRVTRTSDLPLIASMAGVGKVVPMRISRGGHERSVAVRLAAFPSSTVKPAAAVDEPDEPPRAGLGLELVDLGDELREHLRAKAEAGAVVETVAPGSSAARAGLKSGDIVIAIDGRPVDSADVAASIIAAKKRGETLRLKIERRGVRMFAAVKKL